MLRASWIAVLAGAVALAQPDPSSPAETVHAQVISKLLASSDPAKLAWGAYLAGGGKPAAFAADLLRLAVSDDWHVRMAATDAIIRLNLDVSEETLARMASNRLDDAMILISRHPERYPNLIDRLLGDQLDDIDWIALNGILSENPPPGFAARLLRDWTIRSTLTVDSWPSVLYGVPAGVGDHPPSVRTIAQPGFPPLRAYVIEDRPRANDMRLAGGPHPVGYRIQLFDVHSQLSVDRDTYRKDYLVYLSRFDPAQDYVVSQLWAAPRIRWAGEADYRSRAEQMLRTTRAFLACLKRELVARHPLTEAEADANNPSLDVRIVDRRSPKSPPLPDVSWSLLEKNRLPGCAMMAK